MNRMTHDCLARTAEKGVAPSGLTLHLLPLLVWFIATALSCKESDQSPISNLVPVGDDPVEMAVQFWEIPDEQSQPSVKALTLVTPKLAPRSQSAPVAVSQEETSPGANIPSASAPPMQPATAPAGPPASSTLRDYPTLYRTLKSVNKTFGELPAGPIAIGQRQVVVPGTSELAVENLEYEETYGIGGGASGVYRVLFNGMPRVIRFERFRQTAAQMEAQNAFKEEDARSLFSQVLESSVFQNPDGPGYVRIDIMEVGGRSLAVEKRGRPRPLTIDAASDVLRVAAALNRHDIFNADAKAANFVEKIDGVTGRIGAMAIDHGGAIARKHLLDTESVASGGISFVPPEATFRRGFFENEAKFKLRIRAKLNEIVRTEDGLKAANAWTHGQTLYAALTHRYFNHLGGLEQPYPAVAEIRAELIAARRNHPWIEGFEEHLLSLLHPDPRKRGSAEAVLEALGKPPLPLEAPISW